MRIADLLAGEEEVAITGEVVRTSVRRPRPRLAIVQARIADESGEITAVWFNQAWLVDKLLPGTRVRLRGQLQAERVQRPLLRPERRLRDGRLRPGLSRERGDHAEEAPRARREGPGHTLVTTPTRSRPASATRCLCGPTRSRRSIDRVTPRKPSAGDAGSPSTSCSCSRSGSRGAAAVASRKQAPALGKPGELVARYRELLPFELTPHQERAIARDRRRSRQADADGAPASGRGRLGEDRRRSLRAPPRGRVGEEGRADGADRDPRRAALPHARGALPRARPRGRAAHALGQGRPGARRRSSSERTLSSRRAST